MSVAWCGVLFLRLLRSSDLNDKGLGRQGELRSGSHLGQIAAESDTVVAWYRIQNVIQGISQNLHFHKDLAYALAPAFEGASAVELQCSKD